MFQFEPGVAIYTLVSFALVLAVVTKFVYPPVRSVLARREETIRKTLLDTNRSLAEAQGRAVELETRLREMKAEEARILSEARDRAKALYEEYHMKALADVREIRMNHERDLAGMEAEFYRKAEREIQTLVIASCEKVLRTGLPPEIRARILENGVRELEALAASAV